MGTVREQTQRAWGRQTVEFDRRPITEVGNLVREHDSGTVVDKATAVAERLAHVHHQAQLAGLGR